MRLPRWGYEPLKSMGLAFARLLISECLMNISQLIGQIAVSWWIVSRGGAPDLSSYTVVSAMALFVSYLLLAPLSDRYPRRTLIIAGLAFYCLASIAIASMASSRFYVLQWVIICQIVGFAATALITPSADSLAVDVVPAGKLSTAMSMQKAAQSIGQLAGPAIAGGLLALGGVAITLWVNALLLVIAVLLASRLPNLSARPHSVSLSSWFRDLRSGIRASWSVPIERGWVLVNFLTYIFRIPTITLLVPLKIHALGLSARWLAASEAMVAVGVLAGSVGLAAILVQLIGRYTARLGCAVIEGFVFAAVGFTSTPAVLLIAYFAVGVLSSILVLAGVTHRLLARPARYRARMASVTVMSTQVASTIGPTVAGFALLRLPVGEVYSLCGLAAAIAAVGIVFVRDMPSFMALSHEEVTDWYERTYPEAFEET
ncbi:MFS transporter [Burkholderia ubonensis]|uniref:MFS transporter n=1 Tax=Burkholderia ubonensis TaxID=101571 RepID=UPI000A773EBA|nr:MFS transporter [Burkholderia ubonensis]